MAVAAIGNAEYDTEAPLHVKKIEFCTEKPKGLGNIQLRESDEFTKEEPVFIYIELGNCKPEKDGSFYHIRLAMDVDIYYEDGRCIYSEEEANIIDRQVIRRSSDAYMYAKVETQYLKAGAYKIEMAIKDENAEKKAFALARFKIVERS